MSDQPRKLLIPRVQGVSLPEDHVVDITEWHRRSAASAGSWTMARSKKMAQ